MPSGSPSVTIVSQSPDAELKFHGLARKSVRADLSIRTREVHDFTGSLSSRVLDDVWIDAYGGYTIDRYGSDGALFGGAVRLSLFPNFDILIGAQHTQVASRQSVTGPETSAQLTLTYR